GGLDTAAGDTVGDDPQEQLPFPARRGLHASLLGRRALGLALDVVRRSLDQDAPALAPDLVDLVDLERHQVVAAGDPGLQVLVQRAVPAVPVCVSSSSARGCAVLNTIAPSCHL